MQVGLELGESPVSGRGTESLLDIGPKDRAVPVDRGDVPARPEPFPRDGHSDQIAIADNAIGRIEIHPAGAWKIHLHPGVRVAASPSGHVIRAGNEVFAG